MYFYSGFRLTAKQRNFAKKSHRWLGFTQDMYSGHLGERAGFVFQTGVNLKSASPQTDAKVSRYETLMAPDELFWITTMK